MTRILVLYYSSYGHIEQMAYAQAEGARSVADVDAVVKRVPELVPDEIARSAGFKLDQSAPIAEPGELENYDAIIFGTPTRFGNMASQMRNFLDQTGGLWASEGILLALVGRGLGRQDAYVLVQRNAMKAFEGEGEFRTLLHDDADIRKHLSAEDIDREFDLNHALAHVDTIIDRVLEGA